MNIAHKIGTGIGHTGAYAKHAALRVASGSGSFAATVYNSTVEGYVAKDEELAQRRAEIAKARLAAPAVQPPKAQRQKKLATA